MERYRSEWEIEEGVEEMRRKKSGRKKGEWNG